MISPLIQDGCVVVRGDRIVEVGRTQDIKPSRVDEEIDGVLVPGLINAHTHLELSDCWRGEPPTGGFAGWLVGMLQRTRISPEAMQSAVEHAISEGVRQCLRFGVTCVGDISRQCHLTRPLLSQSPLRVVSFGEVQAMAQRRGLLQERVATAVDPTYAGERLTIGLTPHAPYSVEPDGYRLCVEIAKERSLPLTTHLAETPNETPFLAGHQGPFKDLWDAWLTWDELVPRFEGGPIRLAKAVGLLDYPTLLAHMNYVDDAELTLLASSSASVVWCPRTHAYFDHPPHRWTDMLAAGINVCVGTDSCASSPDLNLLDDLRLICRTRPDVDVGLLWSLCTTRAAAALRLDRGNGTIGQGSVADLIAFNTHSSDPLREILETPDMLPNSVWIGGVRQTP